MFAVAAENLRAAVPVVVVNLPVTSLQVPGVVAAGFSIAVHSGPAVDQTAAWQWQELLHPEVAGGILEASWLCWAAGFWVLPLSGYHGSSKPGLLRCVALLQPARQSLIPPA